MFLGKFPGPNYTLAEYFWGLLAGSENPAVGGFKGGFLPRGGWVVVGWVLPVIGVYTGLRGKHTPYPPKSCA